MRINGRHVSQFPNQCVEPPKMGTKYYGSARKEDGYIIIRVDDELHPEFWMEIIIEDKDIEVKNGT